MGIDGLFLYGIKKEISETLNGMRIDRIHQPSKEELVLLLRSSGVGKRLLICARPSAPRIHFTEKTYENPSEPPMFCMLLRKHLSGARFSQIEDTGYERIAVLCFDSVNEMGDSVTVKLAVELIGKQTNIILIGDDGRIIDAVRRSDLEAGGRIIQPGARYEYPEKQEKLDPMTVSTDEFIRAVTDEDTALEKAVVAVLDGVSPTVSREILTASGLDTDMLSGAVGAKEAEKLGTALETLKKYIASPKPTAVADDNGIPFEFSYMPIKQYGTSTREVLFDGFSALLDSVFAERDRKERMRSFSSDLVKLLSNIRARLAKKTALREKELERCKDGEKYRIYGELLKANLYLVERGMPYAQVQNYYDPELKEVRIPLNTALSPAQNAQRYFKEYKKSCNAASVLGELIAQSKAEQQYIESVIDELKRACSLAELAEIRVELIQSGYLRASASERKKKPTVSKPIEAISPDGFRVLIGRNNRQNDELTLKTASNGDMWFHTKNIPGSHVIVFCDGKEMSEETVLFAARLAAKHSDAAESSSVPVDYTRVKYVKKPAGAKPGMVIYKTNKTVFVTPER